MAEDEAYAVVRTFPCQICGRKFNNESLRKHQSVCQKTTVKKRRIFDSGKQRADGSDVVYEKTRETKNVQIFGEKAEDDVAKKNNWREKHTEFIKAIRQARDVTEAIQNGGPLPTFKPSAVPSDYVQCQFCGRHFNSSAAQRHIPFCETQHKRQNFNNSANNKTKLDVKNKFQPPLPGQRKQSSEGSNGYGGSGYNQQAGGGSGHGSGGYSSGGGGGGGYGNSQKTLSGGGAQRKPVRYDANTYNDEPSGRMYAIRNKSNTRNQHEDAMLRTGRNNQNSEINSTLARKRSGNNSQKTSPMNRSMNRRDQTPPGQNKHMVNGKQPTRAPAGGTSRFCVDCGTQFPVEWAKFCCLCGCRRT